MAIRNLVKDPDPMLRKISRPIEKFDDRLHTLVEDMIDTMNEANGVGLAGVQVGILRRIFVIDVGEGPQEFINPEIIEKSGSQTDSEGCLSFPGLYGEVTRAMKVKVTAYDRFGNKFTKEYEGLGARAVQHENDHLDGKAFVDIAKNLEKND